MAQRILLFARNQFVGCEAILGLALPTAVLATLRHSIGTARPLAYMTKIGALVAFPMVVWSFTGFTVELRGEESLKVLNHIKMFVVEPQVDSFASRYPLVRNLKKYIRYNYFSKINIVLLIP